MARNKLELFASSFGEGASRREDISTCEALGRGGFTICESRKRGRDDDNSNPADIAVAKMTHGERKRARFADASIPNSTGDSERHISTRKEMDEKRARKRRHLVREFLDLESHYSKTLMILESHFHRAISDNPKWRYASKQIFRNLAVIFQKTDNLCEKFEKIFGCYDPDETIVSESLNEVLEDLGDEYKAFISKQTFAMSVFEGLSSKDLEFEEKLTSLECLEGCQKRNLKGLLMEIVQRFLRYRLFLQDMIKNSTSRHPDFHPLRKVLADFEEKIAEIDTEKMKADHYNLAAQLETLVDIKPDQRQVLSKDRHILAKLMFTEISEFSGKPSGMLVLFDDSLLIAVNKHRHKFVTQLTGGKKYNASYFPSLNAVTAFDISVDKADKTTFRLSFVESTNDKNSTCGQTVTVRSSSELEKLEFLKAVRVSFKNAGLRLTPEMVKDEEFFRALQLQQKELSKSPMQPPFALMPSNGGSSRVSFSKTLSLRKSLSKSASLVKRKASRIGRRVSKMRGVSKKSGLRKVALSNRNNNASEV